MENFTVKFFHIFHDGTKRKICKRILLPSIFFSFLLLRVLFVTYILTHDIFMGARNFTRGWIKVLFRSSPFFLVIFAEAGSAYTFLLPMIDTSVRYGGFPARISARMKNRAFPRGYWRENMTRNADEKNVPVFPIYPGSPSIRVLFRFFNNFFQIF